jgi:putative DNA primase/helicase
VQDINKLTAETIMDPEVFETIMNDDDIIHRSGLICTLQDKAKMLGAKAKFDMMLKAYEKSYKEKQKAAQQLPEQQAISHITAFSTAKYPEMNCGKWIANDNGIYAEDSKTGEIAKICNHPIIPIQRLINIHTDKEKIKIAYKPLKQWKEIIVDKRTIVDNAKILSLAGNSVNVTSDSAKYLVKYLSDMETINRDVIEVQESTSKMGWIKKEFVPYCNDFEFDNDGNFKEAYESIKSFGSEDAWMHLARKTRKIDRIEPKISIISSLASVLIEPLNALPFIVNLWSDTGKGKTVAMMLATSCWANPSENVYMADAKATATGLEVRMDFLNNLPLMLDDMSQVKEKYQGDFSALVYMLCSGKGKERSNLNLGLNKANTWKNIILTNYEYPLVSETMQGGAINRIIDIEMEDGYIFPNGNEVVQILKENYGFAGKTFVEAIQKMGIERIKEIQKEFYTKIIERAKELGVEKEEKQMLPMSILLTADLIATDQIFKDEQYLDFNECVDYLKNKGEVSENERAYDYIMSAVSINLNKFKPDDRGEYRGEIWGSFKDGYVYIMSNIFSKFCTEGKFSRKSFLSWAEKKELLDCLKDRKTKQKWLDGSLSWCVCLKVPETNKDTETDTNPKQDDDGFMYFNNLNTDDLPFT